jgi:hypothetical protein
MNEDGMLVSREWLERVDAALFGTSRADADGKHVASLFYDVRPARLESAWTQNGAGLWTATASFIVNDVADSSFIFPVVAPTATANPGGTAGTTRFFVIRRGRWELVAGVGGKMTPQEVVDCLQLQRAAFPSVFTVTNDYIYITTANAVTGILPSS